MPKKYNRGDFVKVVGLESRTDLNGKEGVVLKEIGKRYEVDILDLPNTFSLLPKRLEYLGQSCVVIGPCDKGISSDEIPIYTSYLAGPSEYQEKQELKERLDSLKQDSKFSTFLCNNFIDIFIDFLK